MKDICNQLIEGLFGNAINFSIIIILLIVVLFLIYKIGNFLCKKIKNKKTR